MPCYFSLPTRPGHLAIAAGALVGTLVASDPAFSQSPPPTGGAPRAERTRRPPASAAELETAYATVLGARTRDEAIQAVTRLRFSGEAGLAHLKKLLDSPSLRPEVRYLVGSQTLITADPAVAPIAARMLTDPDVQIRRYAAYALGNYGDASATEPILAAIRTETDESTITTLLGALGRTGDKKRAVPVLESYLKPGVSPHVLRGAAFGLSGLKAGSSAPKVLATIDKTMPTEQVDAILHLVHNMMGRPDDEALLAPHAMKRGDPLRLWAVDRFRYSPAPNPKLRVFRRSELARRAAYSGLTDPNPMIRRSAVLALGGTHAGFYLFLTDPKVVSDILAGLDDPEPVVRLAVFPTLHETLLRRGLNVPGALPMPLEAETMRMLRWPIDWTTFPRVVAALDDPAPEVREYAAWMLGITTGYWYGYSDIRLEGDAQVTPEVRRAYGAMWAEMQKRNARQFVVEKLDEVIGRIVKGDEPQLHPHWFRGIKVLTGKNFGWKAEASAAQQAEAVQALAAWWKDNRGKHPVEWIMDELLATGFQNVDDYNLVVAARWGLPDYPPVLFQRKMRQEDPESIQEEMRKWWDTVKLSLG